MNVPQSPTTVYAEITPNPMTMKFVADKLLVANGETIEYTETQPDARSPLAEKLFNFPFVTSIFIANNFVSITKNDLCEWEDVTQEVRSFVQDYLREGKEVVLQSAENVSTDQQEQQQSAGPSLQKKPQNELEEKIFSVLEEYIRPAVEGDGGAIDFHSFEDGVLRVNLRGACSGCPSSSVTLKSGIEQLMHQMVPEVKEVVAHEV